MPIMVIDNLLASNYASKNNLIKRRNYLIFEIGNINAVFDSSNCFICMKGRKIKLLRFLPQGTKRIWRFNSSRFHVKKNLIDRILEHPFYFKMIAENRQKHSHWALCQKHVQSIEKSSTSGYAALYPMSFF